ncbi:hypothetical protein ElyMa_004651700 [Elysia marginata]|uniref:Uncharacterized protein n=1 Tax=Elysia marginata TaxID=1093978 RepID=A0AAV4I1B8_9GAST|nr:hypothetical protein ElyMa_004651700 [Elysia marginata]
MIGSPWSFHFAHYFALCSPVIPSPGRLGSISCCPTSPSQRRELLVPTNLVGNLRGHQVHISPEDLDLRAVWITSPVGDDGSYPRDPASVNMLDHVFVLLEGVVLKLFRN